MYHLPHFKEHDAKLVLEFMKQHPFAMVIGVDEFNQPVATQIPVLIKEKNGDLFLQAHIMKQTDHHKAFEHNKNVLVVFSGAHTYVSASLYENKQQASTWNYQAVHVKGELNFLDEAHLLLMLEELTAHFENNENSPSLYKHLPKEYIDKLTKAIVAFEIKITSIENVFKLSQNRDEKSYQHIMDVFHKGNSDEQYIANEMSKRKDQLFK